MDADDVDRTVPTGLAMGLSTQMPTEDVAIVLFNDGYLVGAVREADTGDMVVGRWTEWDGEWQEVFRVPSYWRGANPDR